MTAELVQLATMLRYGVDNQDYALAREANDFMEALMDDREKCRHALMFGASMLWAITKNDESLMRMRVRMEEEGIA